MNNFFGIVLLLGVAASTFYEHPPNCPLNLALTGSVISTHSGLKITKARCGMLCYKDESCKSFNVKAGYCELNSGETDRNSYGLEASDKLYMEKKTHEMDTKCSPGLPYSITLSSDNVVDALWVNGVLQPKGPNWETLHIPDVHEWFQISSTERQLIAINARMFGGRYWLGVSFLNVLIYSPVKCTGNIETGWSDIGFDDSHWPLADIDLDWNPGWANYHWTDYHPNITQMWTNDNGMSFTIYCRFYVGI